MTGHFLSLQLTVVIVKVVGFVSFKSNSCTRLSRQNVASYPLSKNAQSQLPKSHFPSGKQANLSSHFTSSGYKNMPDGTELLNFVDGYRSWDDYLTNMEQDGTWGDHVILYAAANCYETCIRVISSLPRHDDVTIRPDRHVDCSNPLMLGHVHEVHYVSLQPIQGKAQHITLYKSENVGGKKLKVREHERSTRQQTLSARLAMNERFCIKPEESMSNDLHTAYSDLRMLLKQKETSQLCTIARNVASIPGHTKLCSAGQELDEPQ
ncbi:hypothetical protein ACROYT_G025265 [Oculina patagonica]